MSKVKIPKVKRSSKYWQERLLERDLLFDEISASTDKQLATQFLRVEKKLQKDLELLYDKIVRTEGTNTFSVASMYRYNEYYLMMENLREQMNKLGLKEYEIMDAKLQQMYKHNFAIVGKQLGLRTQVDPLKMEQALNSVWVGNENWSSRIWKNKALLAQRIQDNLVDCLATGASHDRFVEDIMQTFNIGFNDAKRLAVTELAHAQIQSTFDKYKESGIEKYQFIAEMDEKTCTICEELNGKQFRLDEAQTGTNLGPMHPRCRCATLAVINDVEYEDAPNYKE